MTGGIRFEHEEKEWPPRFWKLLITFEHPITKKVIKFGFKDPRRLGRLRLVEGDPLNAEPISKLGFDPVLNLPPFDDFSKLVLKRSVPIKALLLDQSFSAGVGNWVADEILYQAEIHPAQYSNTLTTDELQLLYDKMKYVCETAVAAEGDDSKFPGNWLMKYRWNKGKGTGKGVLPNGQVLKFETVGGRTSAFVPTKQILRKTKVTKATVTTTTTKITKKKRRTTVKEDEEQDEIKTEYIKVKTRTQSRYNFRNNKVKNKDL
ncbi:hypothetical protein RMCBS344292_00179 [Rhizopus microsporus]|nr:hypothetical protein RMCBS344292_00179 [Rhizopus microsporus]